MIRLCKKSFSRNFFLFSFPIVFLIMISPRAKKLCILDKCSKNTKLFSAWRWWIGLLYHPSRSLNLDNVNFVKIQESNEVKLDLFFRNTNLPSQQNHEDVSILVSGLHSQHGNHTLSHCLDQR